ncbi:putative membrane protein [Sinobacterium caligoides]|uniref:Putative membrane protein n=1 Tax=Sinobacterium caligoides TaxID=933926 RepID=A0A3N2E144_9GAMM|nr:DUF2244 domain-containing protein [Sinobacterium caligoides]ROS05747.1 putative membrane protein [Sinobacterium caligoides]
MVTINHSEHTTMVILAPNRSMSWRATRLLMLALSILTLVIAVLFGLAGAWIILPFAGLEAASLCAALYYVALKQSARQVIYTNNDTHTLTVEKGCGHPDQRWQYDLYDTAIAVVEQEQSWSPFTISLYDNEQRHLIGEFLNHDDCEQLISQLKSLGLYVRSSGQQHIVEF